MEDQKNLADIRRRMLAGERISDDDVRVLDDQEYNRGAPRRGRPMIVRPLYYQIEKEGQDGTSHRTLTNSRYENCGIRALLGEGDELSGLKEIVRLEKDPGLRRQHKFGWILCGRSVLTNGRESPMHRKTVMVELGRIAEKYGDHNARSVASWLMTEVHEAELGGEKYTTKKGAEFLRAHRLAWEVEDGRRKPPKPKTEFDHVEALMTKLRDDRPQLEHAKLVEALRTLADQWE